MRVDQESKMIIIVDNNLTKCVQKTNEKFGDKNNQSHLLR